MIIVQTDYPIALCNDHFHPNGTKNDNYTSLALIEELKEHKGIGFDLLDLGCAGGQFAIDCYKDSDCYGIGIEGSDYNIKRAHPNWVKYHNDLLFTADVTKPFSVLDSYVIDCCLDCCPGYELQQFDYVTAWELIEHINLEDMPTFLDNVEKHLKVGGLFLGTISTVPDAIGDIQYHHSVFSERQWKAQILPDLLTHTNLKLIEYPFKNKVRNVPNSFAIGLKYDNKN